jgi:hypothetical protein
MARGPFSGAGQLLVDLKDLADRAVLPIGGKRASVLELQTVLEGPLACRVERRDTFCEPTTKMTLAAPQA